MLGFRARVSSLCFQKDSSRILEFNRSFKGERMSKKPILYGDEASPPVRLTMITAAFLGFEFYFHHIDLFKGENKAEFYKKINPLQKVPALSVDEGIICDSHAIALYMCRRTLSQDLYSEDDMIRAKVDQMIFFNASTLFPVDSAILSEYFAGKWPADEFKVKQWYSAIDYLEFHLNKHKWLAGNKMQLCDFCCMTTLSSLGVILPLLERHVKVKEWMDNLDSMTCFDINKRGVERLRFFVEQHGSGFEKTN